MRLFEQKIYLLDPGINMSFKIYQRVQIDFFFSIYIYRGKKKIEWQQQYLDSLGPKPNGITQLKQVRFLGPNEMGFYL